MLKIKYLILTMLCVVILAPLVSAEPWPSITGKVIKVVDGDTLKISVSGWVTNYRLAAIDTPETYNNRKAKKDIIKCDTTKELMFKQGVLAKEYVQAQVPLGSKVRFTIVDIGRYGRPVIWITPLIPNIVSSGYARVVDYKNMQVSDMTKLYLSEKQAISKNIGIWPTLPCWRP